MLGSELPDPSVNRFHVITMNELYGKAEKYHRKLPFYAKLHFCVLLFSFHLERRPRNKLKGASMWRFWKLKNWKLGQKEINSLWELSAVFEELRKKKQFQVASGCWEPNFERLTRFSSIFFFKIDSRIQESEVLSEVCFKSIVFRWSASDL